jgi:hypothetical protein
MTFLLREQRNIQMVFAKSNSWHVIVFFIYVSFLTGIYGVI